MKPKVSWPFLVILEVIARDFDIPRMQMRWLSPIPQLDNSLKALEYSDRLLEV